MSSRAVEYPRASAALAGLGLTTQLAAAATDTIPIARLVLGVVSRIITLAEDIETSRDALHQLAESARTMGLSISAVVAGRQMSPEVERRLEAIYEVLRSIETIFTRRKAKSAFQKALSYAFTTKQRVESLSHELSRATQDLLCIAVVDTNAQVREDTRYIGEFRRIRLCDVDDLTLISRQRIFRAGYSSQIYSGKVEGSVVALRCFERHSPCDEESYWFKEFLREAVEHDQLLEKLSTVPNLHRNIARLYGKSSREHVDRSNVVKPLRGFRSFTISKFSERPATIESTWETISQLVDAACWLEDRGLTWYPQSSDAVFIDAAGVPIIGLHNDLRSCSAKHWHIGVLGDMLEHAYSAHWESNAFDVLEGRGTKITVPRRLIPTLNAKISTYITNALRSVDPRMVGAFTGSVILRAASSGRTVGPPFYTLYIHHPFEDDNIYMHRVDIRGDKLVHLTMFTSIPTSISDEFRKNLGITVEGSVESFGDISKPTNMRFVPCHPRKRA